MTPRLVDLVFRTKLLLLVPIVLCLSGGIVLALTGRTEKYVSSATVWVERPSEITGGAFTEFNDFASPAENQAAGMNQLLSTKTFVTGVLDRLSGSEGGVYPDARYAEIRENTRIAASGNNVLHISYEASTPEDTAPTVAAILGEYSELYSGQITERAQRAKVFYEDQLDIARTNLSKASGALKAYVAGNPELKDADLNDPPASTLLDNELSNLLAAEQTARDNYDNLLANYAATEVAALSVSGTTTNFVIVDDPEVPVAPVGSAKRDLVVPPLFGVILGTFISSGVFAIRWRLDRTVRLVSDLSNLDPDSPVMALPALKSRQRSWPKSFVRLATAIRTGLRPLPQAPTTEP